MVGTILQTDADNKKSDKKDLKEKLAELRNIDPKLKVFPLKTTFLEDNAIISQIAVVAFLGGIIYLIYKVGHRFFNLKFNELNFSQFVNFLETKNIIAMIIGMMVADNARDFVKSLTNNLILPLLAPILPFLERDYPVQIGPFIFDIGSLVSDLIMLLINLYIIYIVLAMFSQQSAIFGTTVAV